MDTEKGVNISRIPNRSKPWQLDYYAGSKRVRRFFGSKAEAEAERDQIGGKHLVHGEWWAALSPFTRLTIIGVLREIDEAGTNIRQVWEAAKNAGKPVGSVTLEAAIDAILASRRHAKRRESYLTALGLALHRFADGRGGMMVNAITTPQIESWLPSQPNSRSTYINRLNTLFSFCLKRGWISQNPVAAIDRPTIEHKPPRILSPDEAKRLLELCRRKEPGLLPWLCLGLLCGLRPEEADCIEWDDIDQLTGLIRVDAAASKVRYRRLIQMEPAALAWFGACCRDMDAVAIPLSHTTRRRAMQRLRDAMGWKVWPKDITRHTCASYLLAHHQDVGKVAKELGNSPGVLLKHYQELVTKADAEKFWAIRP